MSVQYVKNNTMGGLGSFANIAGLITGQPWLTALGQGINAYGNLRNGATEGYNTPGFQNKNNGGLLGALFGLGNPDIQTQRGK